jgi:hypothetical protein
MINFDFIQCRVRVSSHNLAYLHVDYVVHGRGHNWDTNFLIPCHGEVRITFIY